MAPPSKVAQFSKTAPPWSCFGKLRHFFFSEKLQYALYFAQRDIGKTASSSKSGIIFHFFVSVYKTYFSDSNPYPCVELPPLTFQWYSSL